MVSIDTELIWGYLRLSERGAIPGAVSRCAGGPRKTAVAPLRGAGERHVVCGGGLALRGDGACPGPDDGRVAGRMPDSRRR